MGLLGELVNNFIQGVVEEKTEKFERAETNGFVCAIYISIARYAAESDGNIKDKEEYYFKYLFDRLFSSETGVLNWTGIDEKIISSHKSRVSKYWMKPMSYTDIKKKAKGSSRFLVDLFSIACEMCCADLKITVNEYDFLKSLAKELRISAMDRDRLFQNYGIA